MSAISLNTKIIRADLDRGLPAALRPQRVIADALREGSKVQEIVLVPLSIEDIDQLVPDLPSL